MHALIIRNTKTWIQEIFCYEVQFCGIMPTDTVCSIFCYHLFKGTNSAFDSNTKDMLNVKISKIKEVFGTYFRYFEASITILQICLCCLLTESCRIFCLEGKIELVIFPSQPIWFLPKLFVRQHSKDRDVICSGY